MPAKTNNKKNNQVARFFKKIFSSVPLTALFVMVMFGIVGVAYILISHAAGITAVGFSALPNHSGYYLAQDNGVVQKCSSSNAGTYKNKCYPITSAYSGLKIVSIATDATGNGFWQLVDSGRVINRGDAVSYGSAPSSAGLYKVIVSTPSGKGYWVVSKYGQALPFGDAVGKIKTTVHNYTPTAAGAISNLGSSTIVSADTNNVGTGLFMLGSDGRVWYVGTGVSNAGNATPLASGETATAIYAKNGYRSYVIVTNLGGVYAINWPFAGSYYNKTSEKMVGILAWADAAGGHYWLLGQYGGVFTFGKSTPFYGSAYVGAPPPTTCPTGQTGTPPNCVTATTSGTGGTTSTNPCRTVTPVCALQVKLGVKADNDLGPETGKACVIKWNSLTTDEHLLCASKGYTPSTAQKCPSGQTGTPCHTIGWVYCPSGVWVPHYAECANTNSGNMTHARGYANVTETISPQKSWYSSPCPSFSPNCSSYLKSPASGEICVDYYAKTGGQTVTFGTVYGHKSSGSRVLNVGETKSITVGFGRACQTHWYLGDSKVNSATVKIQASSQVVIIRAFPGWWSNLVTNFKWSPGTFRAL